MQIGQIWSPKKCIWNFCFVGAPELKGEAVQHGKSTVSQLEELVKVGFRPFKSDLAHAIRMMLKCSTQAPKNTAGDFFIKPPVVDENWQRTGQDRLDMLRSFWSHADAQVQTGVGRKHDSAPRSAHMCKIYPRMILRPLVIIRIDALSIIIEYI